MGGFLDWQLLFEYTFYQQFNSYIQRIASYLVFTAALKKRPHYPLRLALCLAVCAAAVVGSVYLKMWWYNSPLARVSIRVIQFALLFFISYVCYDDSFQNHIRVICCGVAARQIGAAVYSFLLVLAGVNENETISLLHPEGYEGGLNTGPLDWILYYGVRLAVYLAVYHLISFKRYDKLDRQSVRELIRLSLYCFVVVVVPDTIRNELGHSEIADTFLNRFYICSLSIFTLLVLNSVDFQRRYRQEKAIMEQVLTEQRKQYQQLKENMEVINVYCHDLRHQMASISGKLTEQEVATLERAMDLYDSNIKTGSEVLDVVLRTCQVRCRGEGIELTCMADGSALSFVETRHLYALCSNALNNAVEAVRKLSDREKRVISVTVERREGQVVMEVVNFFTGELPPEGSSTKREKGQHGFGLRSMGYVANAYGGTLSTQVRGDLYCLTVSLPLPEKAVD